MSTSRHHAEWLSLVPVSGPFLSLPVLLKAFPQGLDAHEPEHAQALRMAFEEWQDATGSNGERRGVRKTQQDPRAAQHEWIRFVLTRTLDFDPALLLEGQAIPQTLQAEMPEHHEWLRPNIVLNDPTTNNARLLIQTYPRTQSLTSYVAGSRWKASPDTRMTELLHATGVRLGLVTNGEHWMLVDAPKGESTGYVSWYASLWLEEKITLKAFRSLLSQTRFFGVADDQTIEALLAESASNQQEVTDRLGLQVRRAVEVLIHSLDKADQDFDRALLTDVPESVLYESALTVMMRLVFLFCAEERELIPSKPFPVYERNYSVSAIINQLEDLAQQHGEELLERRNDAWSRLLTAFRAVYGGLQHEDVYIPAYGGKLFDPDRFPFLEGRAAGTTWREHEAKPLPVNNRTVLHLLKSLQYLEMRASNSGGAIERRRLSFRALDIEQIGHVYEGLLDHTAKRATEPILGLVGAKNKEPEISLAELQKRCDHETHEIHEKEAFVEYLKEQTGKSESALTKALQIELDDQQTSRFRTACQTDELWEQVKPFTGLIRNDTFDYPVIVPAGSVFVTSGTDRRSSGTHYTPRVLTEPIVQYTLEPLVYIGPAEGLPKSEWRLKSGKELLALKICDMACGSGAFLVQACRYLAERLLEAWEAEERGAWGVDREEKGQEDDGAVVSRTGSLEDSDGSGDGLLSSDEAIPKGRDVRDDKSDSQSSGIDSSEHRRRSGARSHEGVSELPQHRKGVADGVTDSSDARAASESAERYRSATAADSLRTNQSDDLEAPAGDDEEGGPSTVNRDPAIRSTVHASRSTPHAPGTHRPRITPHGTRSTGAPNESLIPDDPQERKLYAMRLIAQRCLYGVDINPLAVEMCKLSLWLLTMARDKPFEFLDHNIRCGDSLVGLHNLDQLRHFSLKPDSKEAVLFGGPFEEAVEEAISLRLKLEEMPSNTIEDVRAQEKLLKEADDKIARLRCAADLLVAAEFWGGNARDKQERLRHAAVVSGHYVEHGPTTEFQKKADQERQGQKMFHWPLEFPEVIVERRGFDGIVGNPPFLGGLRISEVLSDEYNTFLFLNNSDASRKSDLVSHFVDRASRLTEQARGCVGFLGTKTIAEGVTKKAGLQRIVSRGASIYRARRPFPWPGVASVQATLAFFSGRTWCGPCYIDEVQVDGITESLMEAEQSIDNVEPLAKNAGHCYVGSYLLSTGFLVSPAQAQEWIDIDPRNSEVLAPYMGGREFNDSPTFEAPRWAINFGEMKKKEAESYCLPFAHIQTHVWPERKDKDAQKYPRMVHEWWKYWHSRHVLYEAIQSLNRVLVRSRVCNRHMVGFIPSSWVYSDALTVFVIDGYDGFAVMQSSLHEAWVNATASTMRTDVRYVQSRCFDAFPQPLNLTAPLESSGKAFYDYRNALLRSRMAGLTKTYAAFHSQVDTSSDIQQLRNLQIEMDQAVAAAYGWDDLELGHGYHETKQGVRFTMCESAQRQVLQRLLKLNHERYAEEVKQGLHDKKRPSANSNAETDDQEIVAPKTKRRAPKKPPRPKSSDAQAVAEERSLFNMEDVE